MCSGWVFIPSQAIFIKPENGELCPCWVHVLDSIWRPLGKPSEGSVLSLLYGVSMRPPEYVKILGDRGILDDRAGVAERPWSGMWASSERVLSSCSLSSLPLLILLHVSNALDERVLCGQIWDISYSYIQIPLSKHRTRVACSTND